MKHATLFSGIGGPEVAAERLGWETVFSCEWEEFPRKVLQYHYPNAKHYGDITELDARQYRGRIDVLTGGFPCQPFSVAGSQNGADDDRFLWPEMFRVIRECKPAWVIGENVTGIVGMGIKSAQTEVGVQGDIFGEGETIYQQSERGILNSICEDLEREGYEVWPIVIPAEAVGAPHRRDRIFIIANSIENRRRTGRTDSGRKIKDKAERSDIQLESERLSKEPIITDTNQERCNNGSDNREERHFQDNINRDAKEDQSERKGWECGIGKVGKNRDVADTDEKRLEGRASVRVQKSKRGSHGFQCSEPSWISRGDWKEFPTQPPICSGNDGIPCGLDGITFSKWRTESIKAYGNAIVPEVIFRIYQAIDQL